ncbi:MAG: helix-turn-helix transcriptional regulator [Ruminococcaceae bacterium]|nr:helix-turn-helix transcriptional regulator [Oscillospiraceae bacterium]
MIFEEIKPFIRHAGQMTGFSNNESETLKSYDNCVIYILSGGGSVAIENETFKMNKGSVLMWRAGMAYRFSFEEKTSYIIVHFDFTNEKRITNSFKITAESPDVFNHERITDRSVFDDYPEFNSVIYSKSARTLEEYFFGIVSEFKKPKNHMNMRAGAKMIIILTELSSAFNFETSTKSNDKVDEIIEYIHEHYTQELTNSDIAKHFNFHPQHINKIIRRKTGYSLHKYVIMRRISKAIDLLETTKMPIAEISDNVGFQNICHFSRYFKEFMGSNPSSYRKITKK